jgi:hypothetical protein
MDILRQGPPCLRLIRLCAVRDSRAVCCYGEYLLVIPSIKIILFGLSIYSLQCSKGSRLGHDCAYQGVINYHRVFPVCPY